MAAAEESWFFSTRSALFQGGDEAWAAVAAYERPLRRLLERRHPWVGPEDREDLVQGLLVDIKERLSQRHDPARGPFRALLQTALARRVSNLRRRRRPDALTDPDALAAPTTQEIDALDLEASLLEAFARCRDRFSQGPQRDPQVLFALADRIVHGRTNVEIARAGAISVDRVARLLRRGREVVLERLVARELGLEEGDPRLGPAAELLGESWRAPGRTRALLEAFPARSLAGSLEELLLRLRAALPHLDAGQGSELRRGLELLLSPEG